MKKKSAFEATLNKWGYAKTEVFIMVVLLGIVAFITINKTSYAFEIDNAKEIKEVISLMEIQAEEYGMDNLDLFEASDTAFILVNDLVDSKYLIGNEKGKITNPANKDIVYNDNKIKLVYDKDKNKIEATFIN